MILGNVLTRYRDSGLLSYIYKHHCLPCDIRQGQILPLTNESRDDESEQCRICFGWCFAAEYPRWLGRRRQLQFMPQHVVDGLPDLCLELSDLFVAEPASSLSFQSVGNSSVYEVSNYDTHWVWDCPQCFVAMHVVVF